MKPVTLLTNYTATALLVASTASGAVSIDPAVNYAVGTQPSGVATGDFDGDGDMDLATTVDIGGNDWIAVLLNDGTGLYSPGPQTFIGNSASPQDIVAGRLNAGATVDVAVAVRDPQGSVLIYSNTGAGSFTQIQSVAVGDRPRGLDIGDHDNDGDMDLAVANRDSDTAHVLTNNGAGSFSAAMLTTGAEPRATAFGNFDGDNDLDLAVTNHDSATVSVFTNTGGAFSLTGTLSVGGVVRPDGIDTGDIDGLNGVDIVVATSNQVPPVNQATIFFNQGNGTFGGPIGYPTGGTNSSDIVAVDLDCDDLLDLVTTNQDSNNISILNNTGAGVFGAAMLMPVGTTPEGLAFSNLDGDTDMDLVVANRDSGNLSVLINQSCAGTATVLPTAFNIPFGDYLSGTVADLHDSDDSYLITQQRAGLSPLLPVIRVEIEGTADGSSASQMVYTFEASVSALPEGVPQELELFNYDSGQWELIDARLGTRTDSVVEVTITTNASRFIQAGTNQVRARGNWFDPFNVFFPAWGASIDQAIWSITP